MEKNLDVSSIICVCQLTRLRLFKSFLNLAIYVRFWILI